MYTLIDGVQFYDKDEVDGLFAQNGSAGLSDRLDQEVIDRTAADDALGTRIDQETQELSDKLTQESQELSDKLTQESNMRLLGDQTLANQLTAIEQLWSTLIAANFIDTDSNAIVSDDSGKSIRQIAHDEFYRQLVTDADNVKQQLDTLKELADYLQNNPTILTDIYTKLGITWSLDTPTDFGTFDFSSVLNATDIDSAIVELHNTLVNKAGDLTQLTTSFKGNIVGAVNELDAEVGDLSTLSTVEKGTIVGAINSEFEWRRKNDADLGTRISDEVTDRMNADLLLDGRIGLLNSLKTTNKSSTVAAINEIYDTVQQGGGGGSIPTPPPTPSDGVDIISIALQSNITGNGEYIETVDLTDLAECVTSNKPYLFEVTAKLPIASYTFKNCSATLVKGTHTTHFDINLLNDIIAADAAKLTFALNHADATNTSVTFTLNDNVTIGGGGGDSGTGTDTTQLEAKLNAEITARTQADADLGARIDADVGDLSTLTTTNKGSVVAAINEVRTLAVTGGGGGGGGTVLPSDSSNVYVLRLTSSVEIAPGAADTIALTPEQVTAVTDAVINNVPIIAIVSSNVGATVDISVALIALSTVLNDDGSVNCALVNTNITSKGSDKLGILTAMLALTISNSTGTASFVLSDMTVSSSGGGGGGGGGGDTTLLETRVAAVEATVATVAEKTRNIQAFTYVVDSNQTFQDWCNGVDGNDYSRVFIKNGFYSINDKTLNLVDVGTKYIYGETAGGVSLSFGGNLSGHLITGNRTEEGIHNIKVSQHSDVDQYDDYVFYNLNNIVNCTAGVESLLWNIGGCFGQCTNLKHCKAETRSKYGFSSCTNLEYCECTAMADNESQHRFIAFDYCRNLYSCSAKASNAGGDAIVGAVGFYGCDVLYNCLSSVVNDTKNNCFSFDDCSKMLQCSSGTIGKSSKCYADSSKKYPAGEGPNGGFNDI